MDDPVITQAIASLIGALTTAILLAAGYYWGPNRRENIRRKRRRDVDDSIESEDSDVE